MSKRVKNCGKPRKVENTGVARYRSEYDQGVQRFVRLIRGAQHTRPVRGFGET